MLDMDEPDEVVAAAGRFRTAITTAATDVGALFDALGLSLDSTSNCRVDQACLGQLDWMQTTFTEAAEECVGQAETTVDSTVVSATALVDADLDSSRSVHETAY